MPEDTYVEPLADGGVMYGTAHVTGKYFSDCHAQIRTLRSAIFNGTRILW